ncbi:uncharacterized protein LOC141851101 [Brevipalpus obovatus]|uniref:uncharacterized protein LOC141851101 n=1 Tax=Brevipalpus obovatus TaxID=246614 RepID=UPI003D9E2FB1
MAIIFIKVISILGILLFDVIDGQKTTTSPVSAKCPYDNNYILGVIVFSVLVTIAIVFLTLVLIYFLIKIKLINIGYIIGEPGKQTEKASLTKNDLVAKDVENGHDYAFDNPYFKDDDSRMTPKSHVRNDRVIYRAQDTNRAIFQLPLNCTTEQKQLSLPNIKKSEQVTVALTGHDFTGLGFNICGNMRHGIFIKDVLTRGPANESGLVKAGDRIMSVTVSFEKMVYEDALTILSYASPYDVELKIEKNPPKPTSNLSHNLVSNRRSAANENSNSSNQRLLHPLYRSHSVEDLTCFAKQQHQPALTKSLGTSKSHGIMKKIKTQLLNARSSLSSLSTTSAISKQSNKDSPPKLHEKILGSSQQSSFTEVYTNEAACERLNSISQKIPSRIVQTSETLKTEDIFLELRLPQLKEESRSDTKPAFMKSRIDSPLKPLEANNKVCTSWNHSPPQPVPRKLPLNKRKAPMPPEQITLSPILKDDKATKRHDSDRKLTPSPSKPIETMAVVHYEPTPSEENLPSITDQQLSSMMIKDFSHITDSDLRDVKEETDIQPSLVPSSTIAKFKSCSLLDLRKVQPKRSNGNTFFPERAVSLDSKSKAFPEENFTGHAAKLDDSEGMVHWETKPYIIHSDSISTAYSSDFISDSVDRFSKRTHETCPNVEESVNDNLDSLNCPISLEAIDAASSRSVNDPSISLECEESSGKQSPIVESVFITSSSDLRRDSSTQIIQETAEGRMKSEAPTPSEPNVPLHPVVICTLSHTSQKFCPSNLPEKTEILNDIVSHGTNHDTTTNLSDINGNLNRFVTYDASSPSERHKIAGTIPPESSKSTETPDLNLNTSTFESLTIKNDEKAETKKLPSLSAIHGENFLQNSSIGECPNVSTVNVRSLEDDENDETCIKERHQFSAKEQRIIQKKELRVESKKNSTQEMPIASTPSTPSALPMISRLYYINSPTLIPMVAHNDDANDFESWSYVSEKGDNNSIEESNITSPSNSPPELRFKTSFVPDLREETETARNKVPEVTCVTSEKGSQESSSNSRNHAAAEQSKF